MKKKLAALGEQLNEIRFCSASLAFSSLLSIIPVFIIVLALLQSIGGLDRFYPEIESLLISYLKEATGSTVSLYIKNSIAQFQPKTVGVTGGILLLITSLGLIRNMDYAIHRIWKTKIISPLYTRVWLYWFILILIPLSLTLYTGIKSINFSTLISQSAEQNFLFSLGTALFLFALYTVFPQRKVFVTSALLPAVLAAISLSVVQKSFLWISLKVFKQNKIYGSLASVPIFLVWLLTVWYVVLSGVALSVYIQNRLEIKKRQKT